MFFVETKRNNLNENHMQITDEIGTSHIDALKKILGFIRSFNVHKLLYAINGRVANEETIRQIKYTIREQHDKLLRQKDYLFRYTGECNDKYALANNKLVDNSHRILYKIRSGVRGIKKTTRSFCKTSRRRWPEGKPAPQAIDRSQLSGMAYMQDLFGLESYPECVKELFTEMLAFYQTMKECLEEGFRTLQEEKVRRKDQVWCLEALQKECERHNKQLEVIKEIINADPQTREALLQNAVLQPNASPMMSAWEASQNDETRLKSFASAYYHNCTPDDIRKITIRKFAREADGDPELLECMSVFKCDREKALCINQVIDQFDGFLPEKCKRGQIPSSHLYVFMRWCSATIGYDKFLQYFNKRYLAAGGKWKPIVSKTALSTVSSYLVSPRGEYLRIERDMLARLDDIDLTPAIEIAE